ncbi:MAG TPA: glycosyltransferase [Candidatus Acidoferrum sp.]|nr:glycosyltransferase [Candidatus Acidoferrum sp.]
MPANRKIHVLFHDAGGGHRNAAVALQAVCEQENRPWELNLVQFQELTDHLDVLRRLTGIRIQEQYNILLRNGWTWGSEFLLRILQLTIRIFHRPLVNLLATYWRQHPADLLISVIPHFNREIAESWTSVYPGRPFVTIITDLADFPPRFWIEPTAEQKVVAGSDRAAQQARDFGKSEGKNLFQASGMILRPEFYAAQKESRAEIRQQLGLDLNLPTAIVLFGGYGSSVIYEIAQRIDAERLPLQLILICGKNEKLAEKLRAQAWKIPVHVVGFSREVNRLMHAADFLIGKPGPGSIAEAMISGLPVLVECNSATLPQERYNTAWVTEKKVGVVVEKFKSEIVPAVRAFLEHGKLEEMKRNVAAQQNRAVFEIPQFLATVLGESAPAASENPATVQASR